MLPTLERVRELLLYDSETGLLSWRSVRRGVRGGTGCKRAGGYILITIDRERILAHRLAIFYVTGLWPEGNVDHIDGDTSNNRFSNLRVVSQQANVQNIRAATRRNKTGLLGVSYHSRDKLWRARIHKNGVTKTWYAKTKEEAHQIYLEEKRKLHEGCTI